MSSICRRQRYYVSISIQQSKIFSCLLLLLLQSCSDFRYQRLGAFKCRVVLSDRFLVKLGAILNCCGGYKCMHAGKEMIFEVGGCFRFG